MTVGDITAIVGAIVVVLGVIVATVRWIANMAVTVKSLEAEDAKHTIAITDGKHALKNQIARIDAIEHMRATDIERIVRLETTVQNFDRAVDSLRHDLKDTKGEIMGALDQWREAFDTSIREIRIVAPKP